MLLKAWREFEKRIIVKCKRTKKLVMGKSHLREKDVKKFVEKLVRRKLNICSLANSLQHAHSTVETLAKWRLININNS